jgi:DNA segregation ATPase FtsK/SpoIIIE, S-DNA-T family
VLQLHRFRHDERETLPPLRRVWSGTGHVTLFPAVVSLIPLAVVARGIWAVWRFARLPSAAKRHYPAALWHRWRWRRLTTNLNLTYEDRYRRARFRPWAPFGTVVTVSGARVGPVKLRHPRARFRADEFGIIATVKTVPRVGRGDLENEAEHIANAWRCHRVQVSQPRPGRVVVRGLRLDPLTLPYAMADAPAGVYDGSVVSGAVSPLRLYLGRDEWAAHRWLTMNGVTGITVGGLPGYGKTSLINSLLMQLAGLPVQFVFIDGKGGGDYADWSERAWLSTGDDLAGAAEVLEDVHELMRRRFGTVLDVTGHRNAWRAPITDQFPIVVVVIDECHTFFDLDGAKGDREAEAYVRTCRTLAGQLVKKGRSVLVITVLITQKQTSDAIPTAIRDNCAYGLSFAVKTKDAAVASLGDHIRDYPSFDPTTLQDPAYVGVCTASLRTGQDPFVRLRVPEITEEAAALRASQTNAKRLDLANVGSPVGTPDLSAALLDGAASDPISAGVS